jgi:hypothetical protein
MDTEIEKAIMSEALSVLSKPLVNAKKELNEIRKMLHNPKTKANDMAALRSKLAYITRQFDLARMSQLQLKQTTIHSLQQIYPDLQLANIGRALDKGLAFYEEEYMRRLLEKKPILGHYATERVSLTIPAVYSKPVKSDMAVLLVYFNACSYKNLERNLRLTIKSLEDAEIPVFLVEHLFKDQEPIFPENGTTVFNTRSDSYMFYKENLLNWLMPKVPAQYTKFYMMDCDLIFEKATWYDDVSALLDTHDVVQPFQEAVWLRSDLKTVMAKRLGFAYGNCLGHNLNLSDYHPGFVWAFRRDFIEPIGMFDFNILGSGDTILASAAIQKKNLESYWRKYNIEDNCNCTYSYINQFNKVRTTYYPNQIVYHLWHGSIKNRKYHERYQLLQSHCLENNISTYKELFELNTYGLYEYNTKIREVLNNTLLDYFQRRDEDGI